MKKKFIFFSFILLWTFPLIASDRKSLIREIRHHRARAPYIWSDLIGKEFKDRILPAPDIIIDYLEKANKLQGIRERPKKPKKDPKFLSDIVNAFEELPEAVRQQINSHVVAVFLVEELYGSGLGETLRNFAYNKLGFIVLDVGALNREGNDWISWRGNSPFVRKGLYMIEAEIEKKVDDHRKAAIKYLLLHEAGHLIGAANWAHPDWNKRGHPKKWPFTRLSWIEPERGWKLKSKYDNIFTNRNKLKFYAFQKASLTSENIGETYDQWLKTDFVSLYASINIYDDFAETYAMYVHVVLQKKLFKIKIVKEGKVVKIFTNPILEKRCENKKKYMDRFFK